MSELCIVLLVHDTDLRSIGGLSTPKMAATYSLQPILALLRVGVIYTRITSRSSMLSYGSNLS